MADEWLDISKQGLELCDQEPIHVIGTIQPHGGLLAANDLSQCVTYASINIEDFVGLSASDVIGRNLRDVIGEEAYAILQAQSLAPAAPDYLRPVLVAVTDHRGKGRQYELHVHRHDGQIVVEFLLPDTGTDDLWQEDRLRQGIVSQLAQADATTELAKMSADIVRMATDFDRVMIYRFAEDNHGEVIAESTNRQDSFLGLHYPASDIPEPARRHFLLNIIRYIPDISAAPIPVIAPDQAPADANSDQPLDLSYAKLRGVSPVHIEYLRNMGVGASMSISLTSNNRLWGLVACHNYEARHLSSGRVRFAELLGATISTLLQSLENTAKLQRSISAEKIASLIEADARAGISLPRSLLDRADTIMKLLRANALYVRHNAETYKIGQVLNDMPDFSRLSQVAHEGTAVDSNLSSTLSLTRSQWEHAAGVAYVEMSEDGSDYLALTREHFEQTIRWAGKPEKITSENSDGSVRLSPRGSFDVWREERIGHSEPFDASDLEALRIIRRGLFAINSLARERSAVRAREAAEQDKAHLRHALLEAGRKSSLGELASALAHELSQPLFAVSNYVNASRRELENLGLPLSQNVRQMMSEAVAEASRAADLVRRLRDFITGGNLERDEMALEDAIRQGVELAMMSANPSAIIQYEIEDDLSKVWADHVQITLVILNLVRNSLAAMRNQPVPTIHIKALTDTENVIVSVRDNGSGIPDDMQDIIFEPFHRSTTSGMGIGLSLCRTIVESHAGRIQVNPDCTSGAEVSFTLPIRPTPRLHR